MGVAAGDTVLVHAAAGGVGSFAVQIAVAKGVTERGGHHVWVRPDSSDRAELARLADAGGLGVHAEHALAPAEAAEAFRLSQSGRTRGKIVLEVG
ncbi:zinc-binding dehydrogenase [Streptomyces sp. NPDC001795]|uniref:zinc-binding dehydrogenase n=1 Tax=Streptomyces sp. NPDC001795 TaxID=3154525 RepID=UPI003328649A